MPEHDNSGSIDKLVKLIFENARAQIAVLASGTRLAWAELRLVASRAGIFVGALLVAAGMMLVGWIMILMIGALALNTHGFSMLQSTLIMFFIHICCFVCLLLFLRYTLKSISFEHTRQALKSSRQSQTGMTDDAAHNADH